MTTPRDLITLALKDSGALGVGQTALAEDENDGFVTLNQMLAQWQRKRFMVYQLVTVSLTSTGAQSYTVGPSGDFNVAVRPDKLQAAFFRQLVNSTPNQVDYPLELILAREDYNNIALKQLASFPSYVFYDPGYPLGTVYPWPVPQATIYSLHLTLPMVLAQFTTLSQTITMPDEYLAAIRFNLAQRFGVIYQLPDNPRLAALAEDALSTVRGANTQIPRLKMPADLVRSGVYNPYSDRIQ